MVIKDFDIIPGIILDGKVYVSNGFVEKLSKVSFLLENIYKAKAIFNVL